MDDEEDYHLPIWAGVLPLTTVVGEPADDGRVPEGVDLPGYVRRYERP